MNDNLLPFNVARETSNNLSNAFRRTQDESSIESILSQAMNSNDPAILQNSIGKILSQVSPERQGTAIQYLQNTMSTLQKKQEQVNRNQAAQQVGINPNLPDALQKIQYENQLLDNRAQGIMGSSASETGMQDQNIFPIGQHQVQQSIDRGLRAASDDQLVQLTGVKGYSEPAKQELKRRQEERNITEKKEDRRSRFGEKLAEKVLVRADEIAEMLPQKQSALNLMNKAITDKDLSFFSRDNLAEITGIEGFRSPEGSIFKTAAKEYFLGNLVRAGARPNQWIEQQISDMLTKIGRSTEANLSVSRALQNELDIDKERVRLTHEIADELDKSGGDYRKLGSMVNTRLSKYAEDKQRELFNDLRAIKSIAEKTYQKLGKVEKGSQISQVVAQALLRQTNNDPKKAAEEARKLGYTVE